MGTLLARLRGWSPLGPIFGKELRIASRKRRTYLLRFAYLGTLLLILLLFHLTAGRDYSGGNIIRRAQHSAEMGEVFFWVFAFFTLCAMAAIGPVLTCTAINAERLHKTLPVLLMTPITAWQIVCGKLFSRLLMALTLIALSLPVLAVVRLLGSVELEQMAAVLSLCVGTVVATAAMGLLLSTLASRAVTVILLSYASMLFLWAFLPMISALLVFQVAVGSNPATFRWFGTFMCLTNPFYGMVLVLTPGGTPFAMVSWPWCVLSYLLFAFGLLALSGLILRRIARREHDGGGPVPAPALPGAAVSASLAETGNPPAKPAIAPPGVAGPAARRSRQVTGNPVLWRELRRPLAARRWQSVASTLVVVGALTLIYSLLSYSPTYRQKPPIMEYEVHIGFALVFCGLLNLLACIISATAIAQEKESDTWTLLLATPLSAWQIVGGKLAGLMRRMMWPAIIIVAHFTAFTVLGVITLPVLGLVLWLMFSGCTIWLATGLHLSLRLKTVTYAVVVNLLLIVLLYGGVAVAAGILGAVFLDTDSGAEIVGLYAPYFYLGTSIEYLSRPPQNTVWMPVFGRVSPGMFFASAILCGLAHLAVTGLVIIYTVLRFDRAVGRAVQIES